MSLGYINATTIAHWVLVRSWQAGGRGFGRTGTVHVKGGGERKRVFTQTTREASCEAKGPVRQTRGKNPKTFPPLDRLVMTTSSPLQNEQIKTVEDTKLTSRKRGGVAQFVKYFPVFVGRIEGLMIGTEGLEIRQNVDAAYDLIVKAMFECLKRMAKMDGEGEDKGQLNYHVILIGASVISDFVGSRVA